MSRRTIQYFQPEQYDQGEPYYVQPEEAHCCWPFSSACCKKKKTYYRPMVLASPRVELPQVHSRIYESRRKPVIQAHEMAEWRRALEEELGSKVGDERFNIFVTEAVLSGASTKKEFIDFVGRR